MTDPHGWLLMAALGFAGLPRPSYDRALWARGWLFLVIVMSLGCTAPVGRPSEAPLGAVIGEGEPHVHLSLVTVPRPEVAASAIDAHVGDLQHSAFLSTFGTASRNPFAPCALVAAGVTGAYLDVYWARAIRGEVSVPRGTNILGMFDDQLRGGRIPRDNPAQTAELVARLFLWSSGGRDGVANTLIKGLTQQQCLDLVYSSARTLRVKVEGIDDTVTSHSHAVRHYSGSLTREATQRFLAGLGDARFGARLAGGTTNPLAPCSLLQALVLARRLSAIWGRVMSVSDDVRAQATPPAAAEAAARLFAEAMREAAAASELVVAAATQEDCLNSMFQPDVIRR